MKVLATYLAVFAPLILSVFIAPEIFLYVLGGNLLNLFIFNSIFRKHGLNKTKHIQYASFYLLFISVFAILSYHSSITGGSPSEPYIPGGDGEKYFHIAKNISSGNPFEQIGFHRINYQGYPLILGYLFKYFGVNLFAGLLFNYTLLMLSVVFISLSTLTITNNIKISQYSLLAAIIIPSFAFHGVMLLKDILIIFSFSLFIYVYAKILHRGLNLFYLVYILLCVLIVGAVRLPFLVIFPIIVLTVGDFNLHKTFFAAFILISLFILMPVLETLNLYDFTSDFVVEVALDTDITKSRIGNPGYDGVAARLVHGHTEWPLWRRLFAIPITTSIQFVTPFAFWTTGFIDHSSRFISVNLNIVWFGFTGVLMMFGVFNSRFIDEPKIKRLFIIGVLFYVFIAFIYGGIIPRYATPGLVFIAPALGYIIYCFKYQLIIRQKLTFFFKAYYFFGAFIFAVYILYKTF